MVMIIRHEREELMMTKESLLAALDEPRKIYSLLKVVDPGGSEEELQLILMQMVDHRSAHLSGLADRWN